MAVVEGVVNDWENSSARPGTRVLQAWRVSVQAQARMAKLAEML